MNQQQRVLIIGAGPSGLSLLRAFECQKQQWKNRLQLVCVEKQSQWGGQWNFIAKEKLDKHGLPIPSTNEYLWTNAPKQCFEYPDYPFEQHFKGKAMPSYLPRQYLREYFINRFQFCEIKKYIKFDTIAYNIIFLKQKNKFVVNIQSLVTNRKSTQIFDYVIVASGHYSKPNLPNVEGLKMFGGKLIHSVEVTDYLDYKNERVLVVGSGLSAEDAILQCYKYGAQSITVTYRSKPMSQKFPPEIEQLPLLNKVKGKKVTFKNGEQREFDTIIMCTGYVHNFTFLEQSLRLRNSSKLWANDLYMGVCLIQNPKLMYIGMQAQYFSFMMFDIQSHFVRNIILGSLKIPSKEEMKENNMKWAQREAQIHNPYDVIDFMGDYIKNLIELSSYKGYPIEKVVQLYVKLQRHKQQNILTFRDNIYQSSITGKWSIMKDQTWLEAGAKFQNGNEDPESTDSIMKQEQKLQETNTQENQPNLIEIATFSTV